MKKEHKTLKVALYCRVAKESPLEIDLQKELLTQYAHSLGHANLATYMDSGASGLTLDRPGFCQMDAAIKAGAIGTVLVKDFTRLGRDMWQVLRWSDGVKHKGVAILSMEQHGQPLISPAMGSMYKAYASQKRKKRK